MLNVVITVENTTSGYHFLGLVFNNQGNPISNAKVTVIYPNSTKTLFTNSSGYFSFYGKPIKIIIAHNGQQKSISLLSYHSYVSVLEFYNCLVLGYALIIGYNGKTAKVIIFISNITLYFYKRATSIGFPPTKNIVLANVTIGQSMRIFKVTIPKGISFVYAVYKINGGYSSEGAPFNLIPLIEVNFLEFIGAFTSYYFSLAFIFLFIYIAYQMFGKLKERGLPLLLARPITRGELYFTRYFSGVLAIFVATAIFTLATSLTAMTLFKFIPSVIIPALLAYSFFNIVVWYSLSFLFYSKLSPSAGLGVSIATWFVFYIGLSFPSLFYPNIANYLKYYVSPISIASIFSNYLTTYSMPSGIILPVSVVVGLLWISVPVIVGYLLFKKIDI